MQTTRESGLGCVVTMVLGASPGIGKTHIARCALASAAAATPGGLAYSVQDCTHLTGSGWVGLDVSTAVASLVAAANGDVARAEDGGILCLDEICKKFTADPAHDGFRTVAVQQELLTLIEGADFQVGGRRGGFDRPYTISARALGFIFCGVLPELGRQMEKRLAGTVRMGFASQTGDKTSAESALRDVLLSAGMIEELLNRVNGILILPNPTPDTLRRIVTAPRGLIWQANQVLAGHGKIQLSEAAVDLVTRFGAAHGFSRAMASIMWRLTEDAAWNWNGGRKTIFYYEEGSIRKVINAMSRGSVGGRIRPVRKGDKDLDIPAPEPEAEPDAEPHGMSAAP